MIDSNIPSLPETNRQLQSELASLKVKQNNNDEIVAELKKQNEKAEQESANLKKRLETDAKNWSSSLEKSQAKELRLEEKLREKEEQMISLIQQVRNGCKKT